MDRIARRPDDLPRDVDAGGPQPVILVEVDRDQPGALSTGTAGAALAACAAVYVAVIATVMASRTVTA